MNRSLRATVRAPMAEAPKRIEVPAGKPPERVDKLIVDALGLSRARAKVLFEDGAVKVNGKRVRKGALAAGGDVVEVVLSAQAEVVAAEVAPEPQPELSLRVAFEDAAVVILDKPAGMPSHPLQPGERGTAANFLVARYPECLATNPAALREGGLVHRLDVETSGLLAAARTPEAHQELRAAFTARAVDKRYLAAVSGPLADEGEIEFPVAHAPGDARKMIALGSDDEAARLKARPARTSFKVLERKGDASLLEVRIDTGVMHQIRVHLSAVGAPILGDALYGGPPSPGLTRQFLHAAKLGFISPASGQRIEAESPLPEDLARAWAAVVAE
jgi:23S rRNA pseudouridine1911/1915/1917 synthase